MDWGASGSPESHAHFQMKLPSTLPVIAHPARWSESTCLFHIPEHLRRRWWNLAAAELLSNSESRPGFEKFQLSFREFAAFKNIPLLSKHDLDVLVRPPDSPEGTA